MVPWTCQNIVTAISRLPHTLHHGYASRQNQCGTHSAYRSRYGHTKATCYDRDGPVPWKSETVLSLLENQIYIQGQVTLGAQQMRDVVIYNDGSRWLIA